MSKRIVIFGATSAIATEVAKRYATERGGERGPISLHLVGRNPAKLAEVVAACDAKGARVTQECADFDHLEANEGVVARALDTLGGVDVALIAHGDLGNQLASERSFAAAEATLRTNFLSVVSLLVPLANACEAARHGTIGVITSVAGERGRPRNYTYGAAKGALSIYLQGLRTRLYAADVAVTTLKLGPVDTPMTRDHAKHLLFGQPHAVARDIVNALDARIAEAFVPGYWAAIMPVVKNTPEWIFQQLPFLSGR